MSFLFRNFYKKKEKDCRADRCFEISCRQVSRMNRDGIVEEEGRGAGEERGRIGIGTEISEIFSD